MIATLLISTLWYGIPSYLKGMGLAAALRHMSMSERKVVLFSPWYAEAVALRDAIPVHYAIDFVMQSANARDISVLAGAVLAPRDVRFFDSWESWRSRRRAKFLHDDRAVNAAPGPPPSPADVVILVDPAATPQFRVVMASR